MSANRLLASLWLLVSAGLLVMPLSVWIRPRACTTPMPGRCSSPADIAIRIYCFATMRAFPAQSPLGKVWGAIGAGLLAWGDCFARHLRGSYPILNAGIGHALSVAGRSLLPAGTAADDHRPAPVQALCGPRYPRSGARALALAALLPVFGYIAYLANAKGLSDPGLFMIAGVHRLPAVRPHPDRRHPADRQRIPRRRRGHVLVVRGRRHRSCTSSPTSSTPTWSASSSTPPAPRSMPAGCSASD